MSDFIDKAKDAVADCRQHATLAKKAEDMVEDQAAKGGTVGSVADKADDAIDSVQGTKD